MVVISGREIREATSEVVGTIVSSVRQALENTPPELSGDIISRGLALAGGGALLKGIDQRIAEDLHIVVTLANDPLAAVVEGAGKCLENEELYNGVSLR